MERAEKHNCIIDCRVSSTKQVSGGGLGSQQAACEVVAKQRGWRVLRIFSKVYSGRKEEREDFEEIIKYITQCKDGDAPVHYFLVKSIDRFTRDGAVSYSEMQSRLAHLGVELIDAYGIVQPEKNTLEHLGFEYSWSKQSPTASAQLMEAQRAKDEVSGILTRMIGASIERIQEGYKVRQANDGFLNEVIFVDGKKKVIQVPDPSRSHYLKEMFNLRATGRYSDKEIVDKVNALGYRSRVRKKWSKDSSGGRSKVVGTTEGACLTVKGLQRTIQKPIYAGVICEKWTHHKPLKAKYDGLVSIETFNLANRGKVVILEGAGDKLELLYNQKDPSKTLAKRLKFNPDFTYDKMVLCPMGCGKPTLSSYSTGKLGIKYPAYHCNRSHYWRVSKEDFEKQINHFLQNIEFTPEFNKSFEFVLLRKYRQREKELAKTSSVIHHNISDLKSEQAEALENFEKTSSPVVRKKLEEKIERLEAEIKAARQQRLHTEIQENDIRSFVRHVQRLMEHPAETLGDNGNPYKQRAFFELVFEGTPTYQEITNGTPKLSLVFRLSKEFMATKSQCVTLRGIEPRF